MRQQRQGQRWSMRPGPACVMACMLVICACAGPRPISVSDDIYKAPGQPDAVFAAVLERATICWPQSGGELAALSVVGEPNSPAGVPAIRLFPPAPADTGSTPDAPVPAFAVEFRTGGQDTALSFPVAAEDAALDRKLRDDVLLWANGSKACG